MAAFKLHHQQLQQPAALHMGEPPSGVSYKQQLRFAISGLCTRDLEQPSVAAARAVLRSLRSNDKQLRAALLDILTGIDAAPKHAARCRLQLAEYAVLECVDHQLLIQVLPKLSQQAGVVLAAHRQDAGCINSLAALLTSCVAKLLLEPQGSYAAIHGKARPPQAVQLVTADLLCEALLFPVITSTYRDPEQTRVSAGSVVLLGLFELLKGHTDQAAVIEAVRRCLGLMLQLLAAGTAAQRAPGVLLPVCSCVEVLGLSMDREGTRRLLRLALKAAAAQHMWQVRRDACQALAVLAASLQFRSLPPLDSGQPAPAQPELVLTPAVELLIAQKPAVVQVLDEVRYDKIAAVRAAAAAAAAEFATLPDPPAEEDDTSPAGRDDTAAGGGSRRATPGKPSRVHDKRRVGRAAPQHTRRRGPPARFVRPKLLPASERDFGVLVFAPPHPPPPPPAPELPPAEPADTSLAHGPDQSPVARRLFDAGTSVHASVDAASQTCAGEGAAGQQPYTVQSPLSGSSNPFFATSSSPSPGLGMEHAELQQQLQHQLQQQLLQQQQQQQQQLGLPGLLAAAGLGASPVRLDISHHVHGRVELGFGHSPSSSPGMGQAASSRGQPKPASPTNTPAGFTGSAATAAAAAVAAGIMSAAAGDAGVQHSVHTFHSLWGPHEQVEPQQEQPAWTSTSAGDVGFEPSFCPQGTASLRDSLEGPEPAAAADGAAAAATAAADTAAAARAPADATAGGAAAGLSDDAGQQDLPAAEASISASSPAAQQGRRQRQRWQTLSCALGSDAANEPPSRQCTPAGEADGASPRSPTSLEVLRSVGERVQHLLETLSLSRQASCSSRQGSKSPVALGMGLGRAAGHGEQPSREASPRLHSTQRSSCSGRSSESSAGSSGAAVAEGAKQQVAPAAACAADTQLPQQVQQQEVLLGGADDLRPGWQQASSAAAALQAELGQAWQDLPHGSAAPQESAVQVEPQPTAGVCLSPHQQEQEGLAGAMQQQQQQQQQDLLPAAQQQPQQQQQQHAGAVCLPAQTDVQQASAATQQQQLEQQQQGMPWLAQGWDGLPSHLEPHLEGDSGAGMWVGSDMQLLGRQEQLVQDSLLSGSPGDSPAPNLTGQQAHTDTPAAAPAAALEDAAAVHTHECSPRQSQSKLSAQDQLQQQLQAESSVQEQLQPVQHSQPELCDAAEPSWQQHGGEAAGSAGHEQPWDVSFMPAAAAASGDGAGAAGDTFSLQFNQLFQPCTEAELPGPSSVRSPVVSAAGVQASAPDPGLVLAASAGVSEARQAEAAAELSGEPSGLSRVDKALQKLQSLRSSLRSIDTSGISPQPVQDSGTLVSSTAGMADLDPSGSSLQVQALSAAGAQVPPGASAALASAKDWIREISQRLQQVAAAGAGEEAAPAGAPTAAAAAAAAAEAAEAPMPGAAGGDRSDAASLRAVLDATLQAPDSPSWVSGGGGAVLAALDGSPKEVGAGSAAALDEGNPPAAASSSAHVVPSPAASAETPVAAVAAAELAAAPGTERVELAASSCGDAWSTLTAGSSSSSAVAGSEPLGSLVQEQLQGLLGSTQHNAQATAEAYAGADADAAAGAIEQLQVAPVCAASPAAADSAQPAAVAVHSSTAVELGTLPQERLPQHLPDMAAAAAAAPQLQQQSPVLEAAQPAAVDSLLAQPTVPAADASQSAVVLAESGQRLQQLLAQPDDTMLLMSFALKLDRLGRRFGLHGQATREQHPSALGGAAEPSPLRLSAASPGMWHAPGAQQPPASPGSPASPVGTPLRPSPAPRGGAAADDGSQAGSSGEPPGPAASCSPAADAPLSQWGSLYGVAEPWQAGPEQQQQQQLQEGEGDEEDEYAETTAQLQDAALRNVLGVGLEQLLAGGEQAVHAVAEVLSGLQQQLRGAGMPPADAAAAGEQLRVEPLVMLLQEDLRRELRRQCCLACCQSAMAAGADVEATLQHQEQLFEHYCWPLLVRLVQSACSSC